MALIKCPDCQSEVSELAPACPKCGRPNAAPLKEERTQLIEATGKEWKAIQLIGGGARAGWLAWGLLDGLRTGREPVRPRNSAYDVSAYPIGSRALLRREDRGLVALRLESSDMRANRRAVVGVRTGDRKVGME